MYLKTARIRHYKSLDAVDLHLEPGLTLIVGPNASGKSNIIDALRFVHDAVTDGLEHAVSVRDGITRIRQYSKTKPFKVSMELEFEGEPDGASAPPMLDYTFALKSKEGGNYVVESESGLLERMSKELANALGGKGTEIEPNVRLKRNSTGKFSAPPLWTDLRVADDQLAIGSVGLSSLEFGFSRDSVREFIEGWRYYSLYPNTLRELSSPDRDDKLNESGKNYASVIKQLKRSKQGRDALNRIYETMQQIVPSFQDVSISTVGGFLVPKFRFSVDGQPVDYDARQLSDGTLRVFGLLLALNQVPAPKLLLIEEPEQNVQPGVLAVLADAFREASSRTQIVVTTHSPNFVDHFSPDEVRVTNLSKGLTVVAPIKASQKRSVQRQLLSLSEFMLAEGLVPEGVE